MVPPDNLWATQVNLVDAFGAVMNHPAFQNLGITLDEENAYGSLDGEQFGLIAQEAFGTNFIMALLIGGDVRLMQRYVIHGQNISVTDLLHNKVVDLGDVNQYANVEGNTSLSQRELFAQNVESVLTTIPDWARNPQSLASAFALARGGRCNLDPNAPEYQNFRTQVKNVGINVAIDVGPAGVALAQGRKLFTILWLVLASLRDQGLSGILTQGRPYPELLDAVEHLLNYIQHNCPGSYEGPTGQSELSLSGSLGKAIRSNNIFVWNASTDVGLLELRVTATKGKVTVTNVAPLASFGPAMDVVFRLWPQERGFITYEYRCPTDPPSQPIEDNLIVTHNDSNRSSAVIKVKIDCTGAAISDLVMSNNSMYAYAKQNASDLPTDLNYDEVSVHFYNTGTADLTFSATLVTPINSSAHLDIRYLGDTTLNPWITSGIRLKGYCGDIGFVTTVEVRLNFADGSGRFFEPKVLRIPWTCNKVTLAVSMIGSPYNGPSQDCPRVKAKITLTSTIPIPNFTPDWISIILAGWRADAGDWSNGSNAQDWQKVAHRELTQSGNDYYFTGARACNFYQGADLPFKVDIRLNKDYAKIVSRASTTFRIEDNRWPGVVVYSHLGGLSNYVFNWNAYWTPPEANDPNWPKYGENLEPLNDKQHYSVPIPMNGFKVLMRGEVAYAVDVTLNGYADKPKVRSIVMRMPIDDDPVVRYGVNSYFILVVAGAECPTLQDISLRTQYPYDPSLYPCVKTPGPLVPNGWLKNWPWWIR